MTFIKKSDARAKLIRTLDSILPTESAEVQLLYVLVESVSGVTKPISIKVSGRQQFDELKDKLGGNVEIVYGIEFKSSLNDQFVQIFEKQIIDNPRYDYDNRYELESCLGCQAIMSNVKLNKQCVDSNEGLTCRQCLCKPMW